MAAEVGGLVRRGALLGRLGLSRLRLRGLLLSGLGLSGLGLSGLRRARGGRRRLGVGGGVGGFHLGGRAALGQAGLARADRPGAGALRGQDLLRDGDLLALAGLVGLRGVRAAAEGLPGALAELQSAVVPVAGVDAPVPAALALGDLVPDGDRRGLGAGGGEERHREAYAGHARYGDDLLGLGTTTVTTVTNEQHEDVPLRTPAR